jgi:UPF0755 protein
MKKLLILIGIIVCVLIGWRWWYTSALSPVDPLSDQRISVTIPSGTSSAEIADVLEEKGLIKSSSAFLSYAKKEGKAVSLQAGTFVLMPSMSVAEIVNALSTGETQEMSVTIPEGYTVKDIDALLTEKGLIEAGEAIECANTCDFTSFSFLPSLRGLAHRGGRLEGYLYPDTYFIDTSDFNVKFFFERMLGTFRTKVIDAFGDDIGASERSLHEVVTIASLVEEESRHAEERAMVAGILWKRFDEGIGLYVDASNRYILDKPTATITVADLNLDSPYNLRKYRGLPPGPIANPSISSIEAALNPEASPYYYYLHGSDGQIHYAVTNDEHNANRAKYLY